MTTVAQVWKSEDECDNDGKEEVVSCQLDDLFIDHWLFVLIVFVSQHPINRETGYSNVLRRGMVVMEMMVVMESERRALTTFAQVW